MLNNKIDCKAVGETSPEGFSPTLSLELSTDNRNYQEAVKESNEPQLASDTTAKVSSLIS
jgi:hypothetical protein